MEISDKLRQADGQPVKLTGYRVQQEGLEGGEPLRTSWLYKMLMV